MGHHFHSYVKLQEGTRWNWILPSCALHPGLGTKMPQQAGILYIRSPNRKTPWKKAAPGSKTPWLWRTEKPQNCTPKMPNVTSETHRKWCFWLLFPLAAAMNFSYLYIRSPNRKTPWKKAAPGSKTLWLWRTEKPQNCTPKMPNMTSETHRKWCFWLLFPLAAAMHFSYLYIRSPNRKTPWKKAAPGSKTPWLWRTEKPQNCTPKMPNATSETHRKWCFWLLFPLAAAMNFSYLYIRSPNRKTPWKKAAPGSKTPWLWRTEKPQNCTPKMPNATSETHRKWCFWRLFPLAAAMHFSYLYIRSPNRKTPWKKAAPGSKTPWLWRTEKPQNCTPKMPNVTSETHRKWCFWLLFPLAAAMNFSYLYIRSPNRKTPWKKAAPGSKTPWLWRTEKPQNCTPKMPNVTSETHRKWCFWLLFPLAAAMNFSYLYIRSPNRKTPWKKAAPGSKTPWLWRTEKPQNCTPKMPNATSETHGKWCFWLLFPLAAAMNFSYLYIRSPNRKTPWKKAAPGSKTPWLWRTEKPQNCTPKMPNVTSETHRKWCFWLLFPLAAAMNFSYLYVRSPNRKTPWKKAAPGSKTPWLWRTEKPQNCTPKMPNATSETHRKWCFWLLFPLAAAMNFSYLYIRSPNRKTPWKKAAPGSKTPWLWRTEKPQNCTPKMPNVTSETHRKWCFWLLFPLAAAMNFSYLYIRSPNRKTPWKKAAPGSKTPWLWRTEKAQNCTPKMPNVTSETHRKWCFWLLFPLAAAMNFNYLYIRSPNRKTPWKKAAPGSKTPWLWRTEKPQNCTPKMPNATSETHRKWCFWLLFPLAAAMNFSYLYIRSPNRKTPWKKAAPGSKTPWLWRTEKPQNCTPKMPNATSETHRKWCFWLLFPLAAAMNFSYLYIRSPNRKTPWKKAAPGSKTPWLWRTEKPQNCTPKMPNATSETHRKWCFWLLFPLAAAMNFSYLYIRSPNRKTPWKKAAPGSKTPWLWRTEKPQNCTPKMPNATSETHRKWCFWLLFPLAAAMNFSYLYIRSPNSKTPWKKAAPGSKTPWLWRTEKPQNCTPKMPNVTSETHRKWCFWLLFPLAAAMNFSYLYIRSPNRKTPWKKAAPGSKTPWLWRTEKPQNCTPKMPNATSETHRQWCFWLLFPLAAAMNFSYLYIRSPNRKTPWKKAAPGSKTPWLWRTEKPQNCTPKMPNATSETHRKWCFWLLFPLAAAMNFSYLYIRSPNRKTPWKKAAPGSKTPWLWRTEKPQNCTPKMPNATSETHRKWCFWLLFPLAAAMNFSYLYIRSPNRKTPWKKAAPGSKTPWLWRTEKPQNCRQPTIESHPVPVSHRARFRWHVLRRARKHNRAQQNTTSLPAACRCLLLLAAAQKAPITCNQRRVLLLLLLLLLFAESWLLTTGCLLPASWLLAALLLPASCSCRWLLQKRRSRTGKHHGTEEYCCCCCCCCCCKLPNGRRKMSYSLARSPLRRPGSADIYIYIYMYTYIHTQKITRFFGGKNPVISGLSWLGFPRIVGIFDRK